MAADSLGNSYGYGFVHFETEEVPNIRIEIRESKISWGFANFFVLCCLPLFNIMVFAVHPDAWAGLAGVLMVQAALDAIAKLNNMEVGAKRIQVHHTRYDFTQNLFFLVSLVLLLCIYLSGKRCLLSIPIHGGLCGQLFIFHIQQCFDGKPWGLHVRKPQGYPECKWWQPQSEWSVSPCQTESLWVFCPKVPILSPISMWSASQHIGMRLQFDSVDSKHSSNWLNWLNWYCSWLKSTNFSKEPPTSSSGGQNHP